MIRFCHYFNTKDPKDPKDTKDTKDTKVHEGFQTHPRFVALEHVFVQLHTNTVRAPLALKPGGVLLTKNSPA